MCRLLLLHFLHEVLEAGRYIDLGSLRKVTDEVDSRAVRVVERECKKRLVRYLEQVHALSHVGDYIFRREHYALSFSRRAGSEHDGSESVFVDLIIVV